jgi:hypothetical protein
VEGTKILSTPTGVDTKHLSGSLSRTVLEKGATEKVIRGHKDTLLPTDKTLTHLTLNVTRFLTSSHLQREPKAGFLPKWRKDGIPTYSIKPSMIHASNVALFSNNIDM